MSLFGSIVGGIVDAASDVVSDVVDSVEDAVEIVTDATVAVSEGAVEFAGDVLDVGLDIADDTIFDSVDFITAGAIDLDYDGGAFSADIGIDGVANVGVTISEDGVEASLEATVLNADIGVTDDGFTAGASGGINFGPLPYAEGHVEVTADGDVTVHGYAQGTIPLPTGGVLSGSGGVDFAANDAGWGISGNASGTYTMASGTQMGGGVQAGYMETADGDSHTTFGAQGYVSSPGVGTISGGVGYDRVDQDGVVIEQFSAEGHAEGFGMSVDGNIDHVGVESAQGSYSDWSGDVDIKGLDADSLVALGSALVGLDAEQVNGVLGQVAENGDLATLLGGMDAADTEALIGQLIGAPTAAAADGSPVGGVSDAGAPGYMADPTDLVGARPAGSPDLMGSAMGATSGSARDDLLVEDLLGSDVLGGTSSAVDPDSIVTELDTDYPMFSADDGASMPSSDDVVSGADSSFDDASTDVTFDEPTYSAPEPEPAYDSQDDFSRAISTADQVGVDLDSNVDTMFDDLG